VNDPGRPKRRLGDGLMGKEVFAGEDVEMPGNCDSSRGVDHEPDGVARSGRGIVVVLVLGEGEGGIGSAAADAGSEEAEVQDEEDDDGKLIVGSGGNCSDSNPLRV